MKVKNLFVLVVVLLATASFARADIIGWSCQDDGDGAIDCVAAFNGAEPYVMSIEGDQYWGPGHMEGSFTTDTAVDPTVTMNTAIDNDTSFAWAGYQVNVYMDSTFTLSDAAVASPTDWTAAITQPTLVGGEYVGSILYQGGTPIDVNGTLEFGYKMSFSGSMGYNFCQEMTPVAVPEPTTLVLLSLAGLMGLAYRRRG